MSKILIGMTRSDTTVSGSFVHIRQMGNFFKENGNEVIYVLGGIGSAIDVLNREGHRVIGIPSLKRSICIYEDIQSFFIIMYLIYKEKPDVCSWHTAKIGALGRIASAILAVKSFYVAHGVPFYRTEKNKGYKIYEKLEKLLAYLPGKIICVCDFDKNEYIRIGVQEHKLKIIYNGMRDIIESKIELFREKKVNKKLKFITAARFEKQKDYDTLHEAFKIISDEGYDFILDIYGNGPEEQRIRMLFSDFMPGVVNFCGVVDNFNEKLINNDVFVLSAHWEGLPRSIIEAMSCGLPVIATDVGGVSELVIDGVNGFLVPKESGEYMAKMLKNYLADDLMIKNHGESGRYLFRQKYDMNNMLRNYEEEYLTKR